MTRPRVAATQMSGRMGTSSRRAMDRRALSLQPARTVTHTDGLTALQVNELARVHPRDANRPYFGVVDNRNVGTHADFRRRLDDAHREDVAPRLEVFDLDTERVVLSQDLPARKAHRDESPLGDRTDLSSSPH